MTEPWGRVDDQGTVWVRVGGGERPVGSYPGASPEDALTYFTRKFDGLVVEVDLLERRIATTDVAVKDAATTLERVRAHIASASAVGDVEGLLGRLDALSASVQARRVELGTERARSREVARAAKEALVTEAESLAESTDWKASGDRLRDLLEAWKAAPRLERKLDDELWHRFSTARTTFDKHRRMHFAALDAERSEAQVRKEELVVEAAQLAESTDWAATASRFRELMAQWKAAGRANRAAEDSLWEKFRGAQDRFFTARNTDLAERDSGQRESLERKADLIAQAEALLPVTDLAAARQALRSIHERWGAVGNVPREARPRLENRLKVVEDAITEAEQDEWRRTNPEARARAEAAVEQLRAGIAALEAKAAQARAAGDSRRGAEHEAAAAARREWLAEAERALTEFSR